MSSNVYIAFYYIHLKNSVKEVMTVIFIKALFKCDK